MLIIGLTGGIGSGKSTVTSLFETLGVPVIDADIISRQLVEPGPEALTEIAKKFGPAIITPEGRLNRRQLREIIFSSPRQRKQLEEVLHPRILAQMQRQAEQLETPYCIFSIPLLLEAKQQDAVDRVLVIDAADETRRLRIKNRDHLTDHQIDAILKTQLERHERLANADEIITNNGDIETLRQQVEALHQYYQAMAKST